MSADETDAPIEMPPPPLAESEELPPPLIVGRDRLTFSVARRSVHVPLASLLEVGEPAVVPLLLYGLVLTLHDIDVTLRSALEMSKAEVERAHAMQDGGAFDVASGMLEKLGISLPDLFAGLPPTVRRPAGDGKGAG